MDENSFQKIYSLYEEMEYHFQYKIEQFMSDLVQELSEDLSELESAPDEIVEGSVRLLQFRDLFQRHRTIFTKLFVSCTNDVNGVDTLIELCDYYKSLYDNVPHTSYNPVKILDDPECMLFYVFTLMIENDTITASRVWKTLSIIVGSSKHFFVTHQKVMTLFPQFNTLAMVLMADCDLNAAVQTLIRSSKTTYFKVRRILVQEPIKIQLINMLKNYECEAGILSTLYVFRNTAEAIDNLNANKKLESISVWSENIIAAKKFATKLKSDKVWINASGVLSAGFDAILHPFQYLRENNFSGLEIKDNNVSLNTPTNTSKNYDLFYDGKWQVSSDRKYWMNQDQVYFARAREEDVRNCRAAAYKGFNIWRSKKLSERVKTIRCFADRLKANGEYEYADAILQFLGRPLEFGSSFHSVRDGEAEIITTPEPVGVIAIASDDQEMLFAKLAIALVTGNAVIVTLTHESSASFASYCDFLGTCGFPPGVISYLFITDSNIELHVDRTILRSNESTYLKSVVEDGIEVNKKMIYNYLFTLVTKPKSIWLQCG